MRDRWRGKGYVVAMRNQCRRIVEHDAACRREQRLKLLVLSGAQCAEIIMDTDPAGFRLTDTAATEIAALFDRLNPSGRNWSITNNCLAVIRRVPVDQAEEVAAALVKIALGCLVGATGDSGVSATGEFPQLSRFGEAGPVAGLEPEGPYLGGFGREASLTKPIKTSPR